MKIYQYPPSILTVAAQDSFFQYNGAQQVVEQDTTNDANNRAFPSLQFIYVDGDQVPVTKDNVTPANTVPLPVEIIGTGAIGTVRVTNQLIPVNFDELVVSYVGATTDISTVVYKLATATVATVTLSYDGSNRLTGVVRS